MPVRAGAATGGNTGIGLALVSASLGYGAVFTMPEIISKNKQDMMKLLGAQVRLQPLVGFDVRAWRRTAGSRYPGGPCISRS